MNQFAQKYFFFFSVLKTHCTVYRYTPIQEDMWIRRIISRFLVWQTSRRKYASSQTNNTLMYELLTYFSNQNLDVGLWESSICCSFGLYWQCSGLSQQLSPQIFTKLWLFSNPNPLSLLSGLRGKPCTIRRNYCTRQCFSELSFLLIWGLDITGGSKPIIPNIALGRPLFRDNVCR